MNPKTPITYEEFGAFGDGVADDLPAIVAAHAHANSQGMPVHARRSAIYHLGGQALTAVIATDTNWGTARFVIDDTCVDDHKASLFAVRSLLPPVDISIHRLSRNQKALGLCLEQDCVVLVENSSVRRFIWRGLNRNNGDPQHDVFILRRDGTIDSPVDWDYEQITRVSARPVDREKLTIRGGCIHHTGQPYGAEGGLHLLGAQYPELGYALDSRHHNM